MDIIGEPLEDTIGQQLIVSLVDSVRERFDTGDQLTVNVAKIINNFKSWPIEAEEDFGDVELAQLVDFYGTFLEGADLDANLIEVEWQSRKNIYTKISIQCAMLHGLGCAQSIKKMHPTS
ncbi:uncharacterized protein [Apostichopus japonicus]|uniref:uncharacterized protein n=1 Tax=Stichopus japonicus TaxID=307972 RepID=UPI003AB5BF03